MKVPIIRLEMVVDGYTEYLREQLSTSGKAAEWAWKNIVRNSNREHIIVVGCDANSCATYIDEVGRGAVYCCPGTIPEIFKAAIISNATRILLFHNHPGGSLQPSQIDKEFTKNVRKAGELLGIELSDHIIIGRDGAYYSFMEANIFFPWRGYGKRRLSLRWGCLFSIMGVRRGSCWNIAARSLHCGLSLREPGMMWK